MKMFTFNKFFVMRGFVIISRLKEHINLYIFIKKQQKTQRQIGFINQSGPMN